MAQTQLEIGSVATAFTRAGGTIQGELAACQRYYYAHVSGNTKMFANANALSATFAQGYIQFPVTMRTSPSALEQNGAPSDYSIRISGASYVLCSAVPTFATGAGGEVGVTGAIGTTGAAGV
jgi:hypothetical protein